MHRLSEHGIEELIGLVAGEDPPPGSATMLHRRTGGDSGQVLIHLLGALTEGRALHEGLAGFADDGPTLPAPVSGTFRHEGDHWTLSYAAQSVLVRDARGLPDPAHPVAWESCARRARSQEIEDRVRHRGLEGEPA
jgi:hypothetical protein